MTVDIQVKLLFSLKLASVAMDPVSAIAESTGCATSFCTFGGCWWQRDARRLHSLVFEACRHTAVFRISSGCSLLSTRIEQCYRWVSVENFTHAAEQVLTEHAQHADQVGEESGATEEDHLSSSAISQKKYWQRHCEPMVDGVSTSSVSEIVGGVRR